jgi:hypothetical protein
MDSRVGVCENDLGYPRSRGAKLVMAFCVGVTLIGGVWLTVSGLS